MSEVSLQLKGTIDSKLHADYLTRSRQTFVDCNRVLVIGLGQIGLPVAKYIKEKGFETYGLDIDEKVMQYANTLGIKESDKLGSFGVYILCLPTHRPDDISRPQIDSLLSIVEKISKEAETGALISIESTIPRGTSRKVFNLVDHRLHVAHVPHRWYASEEYEHGVNQIRVAGGVCDCCLEAALQFYGGFEVWERRSNVRGISGDPAAATVDNITTRVGCFSNHISNLGIPLHAVSDIEIAEICKTAENAHRYIQIAFAEDLYLYCQANSINFPELREALNTKWNVNILEPRDGIGGHCLPKDTRLFLASSKIESKITRAAMKVDEKYRKYRQSRFQNTVSIDSSSAYVHS
jgi:UDP-N-acetyl-D-mannosaminuronic acid dehydrogenase